MGTGFLLGGALCAPPCPPELQKSLPWIGLSSLSLCRTPAAVYYDLSLLNIELRAAKRPKYRGLLGATHVFWFSEL